MNCMYFFIFYLDGKDSILEPLSLPESPGGSIPPDNSTSVPCILCEENYSLTEKDALLKHLILEHKLVIADVKLIADFRRYILYWRKRFPEQPITDFCSVIRTNSEGPVEGQEDYFLLCDVLPEDRLLREQLQQKRLEEILEQQQRERNDASFHRVCTFCNEEFTGNRLLILNHMAIEHGFNMGLPDNIVYCTEFLDTLQRKLDNAKARQSALGGLKTAMASKILYEFILERRMTITDSIERCLKKGKGDEQCAAASLACLLCIQLGAGIESEDVFKTLKPIFKNILADGTANIQTRQACATSLGVCSLVAADDILDVYATMECFESLFAKSYVKEDGTRSVNNAQTTVLHINALLSWTLLLTICSNTEVKNILKKHLPKLPSLLDCDDVNMRIAAGETLALLFELARDVDAEFEYEDLESLCAKLRALATDGNKHRAKNDKRKQRPVFRDVLRAVEEGEFQTEMIKFGAERMYIDSWVIKRTYDAFTEFVGSGMNYHLQANEFIRNVFELGPPMMVDAATLKAMKISRFERHLYNAAAFKARTKARNKFRDKRKCSTQTLSAVRPVCPVTPCWTSCPVTSLCYTAGSSQQGAVGGIKERAPLDSEWDHPPVAGKFGTGILSYFSFLRFLVLLNFVMFVLIFGFITLPVVISSYGFGNGTSSYTDVSDCTTYPSSSRQGLVLFHQYIIDLLSGTGFLEETYLFYGYYRVSTVHFTKFMYNVPLAYLLVTIGYLLLSLLWIVKRSVEGFKQNLVQDQDRFQSFCNKIFAGWDFCITDESAARLKHSSLQYELKTDLEEERIKQKIAERTLAEKGRIYLLRLVLNLFVLGVLAGCFYAIYRATIYSQEQATLIKPKNFILDLIVEYLPSIVITLANFVTPLIFDVIIQFEDYTPAFEIRFTLMRCVFVRLASIGVLLFSLWSQITACVEPCPCGYNHKLYPCWESRVGQEMYKLMIFDFIIIAAVTILVEFPRKLIVMHCPCALTLWWGQQEFAIPTNVLEIVYGQTICWIGAFYCPLLPAISTIKYFIIFYIKKVSLMQNCRPSTRPFRASSSNFFFLAVLLIGLAMACVPVGVSIAQINSSKACGPFVNYTTSWEVVPNTIDQLPPSLRSFFHGVGSEAFAVPFFVVVCMVLFYFIALAGAHKRVVNQLRDQLIMEGRDKRFLIQKLYQAQKESWMSPHHRSGSGISQPLGSGQLSRVFLEQHTGASMTHA
ncbi:UNVERIFIED_CONTAM: hypothetical protein FKN15_071435 [Acipenser sinensis]